MAESIAEQKEYSPEEARDKLWTFIESEREATRVVPPGLTRAHFLFTPGFPLPADIVKEDILRIPDDEVIMFSKAQDGVLTKEEFNAYNKIFFDAEKSPTTIDPLRHALLYYVRSRMSTPEVNISEESQN